jgi:hypothetical protein
MKVWLMAAKLLFVFTAPVEKREPAAVLGYGRSFSLGVISLLKEDQHGSSKLQELRQQERVAVIYAQDGDKFVPQDRDIYRLINFLTILRFRASAREGLLFINYVE